CSHHTTHRSRKQGLRRQIGRLRHACQPTGRAHDVDIGTARDGRRLGGELRKILSHRRLHVSIDANGACPLVFPELGRYLRRQRNRQVRMMLREPLTDGLLVQWIEERKQQAYRNRVDAQRTELGANSLQLTRIQRYLDLAGRIDALRHLEYALPRHERDWRSVEKIVYV